MAKVLRGLGYKIQEVRNAPKNSLHQKVEFGPGAKKQAREISILLSGKDVSAFNSKLAPGHIYVTVGIHSFWRVE